MSAQEAPLPKGQVIDSVKAKDAPTQDYALYLPSQYDPARKWPIVYAFDPGAEGRIPVLLTKEMAEKYGYIVAGSNVSRNGSWEGPKAAMDAMWKDTHARFNLDDKRVVFTGFSGGARASFSFAMLCQCAEAVIAQGAGFEPQLAPDTKKYGIPKFAVFEFIGTMDFNYLEVADLGDKLDKLGVLNRIRRYEAPHQWAPVEMWQEAFAWLVTHEMKEKTRALDAAFVENRFAALKQQYSTFAKSEFPVDRYAAYYGLQKTTEEFIGLIDDARLQELRTQSAGVMNAKELGNYKKQEKQELEEQQRMVDQLRRSLRNYLNDDATSGNELRLEFLAKDLSKEQEKAQATDPAKAALLRRVLGSGYVEAIESGDSFLRKKDAAQALKLFQAAAVIAPKGFYPYLEQARAHMAMNKKKETYADIQTSIAHGLNNLELLLSLPELKPLHEETEFKVIVEKLTKK